MNFSVGLDIMTINKLTSIITTLPLLWVFTGLFIYDSDKDFVFICVVCFLFHIISNRKINIRDQISQSPFIAILIASSILAIITKLYVGQSTSVLRVLISVTLLSMVINNTIIQRVKNNSVYLVSLSGVISFFYIYIHSELWHLPRHEWSVNAIPYTTMAAAISIISLYYFFRLKSRTQKLFAIIGYIFSFYGVIMSETRGTLIALITATIILFTYQVIQNKSKKHIVKLSIVPILILTLLAINTNFFKQRYISTKNEISSIYNGNLNTSIGYRIAMWQAGLELSKEPTLLGLGDSHIQEKQRLVDDGKALQISVKWSHYHNDYISTFVKKGILGFILLIITLCFPFYYHLKFKNEDSLIPCYVSIVYAVASLTDIPLSQSNSLILYLMIILLFCRNPISEGASYEK